MAHAAITTGPRTVSIEAVPERRPGTGEVLVDVRAVGICGTDLHIFDGSFPGVEYPLVQGHEFAGVVAEVPAGVEGLSVGELVAVEPVVSCGCCYPCRVDRANACVAMRALGVQLPGGLQDQVIVPADHCYPVGSLDPMLAALCEPVSVALHAITRAGVRSGEKVLVLGAGPIGLATVLAASHQGAEVMAVELLPLRRALAQELGASEVVEPGTAAALERLVHRWTGGEGPAVVVEATGVASVAADAIHLSAAAGRVAIVGVSDAELVVNLRDLTRKELTIVGTRATQQFAAAVDLVRECADALALLVTHRFPFRSTERAFRTALDDPGGAVKVMIVSD